VSLIWNHPARVADPREVKFVELGMGTVDLAYIVDELAAQGTVISVLRSSTYPGEARVRVRRLTGLPGQPNEKGQTGPSKVAYRSGGGLVPRKHRLRHSFGRFRSRNATN
jgi:hypothetical protein